MAQATLSLTSQNGWSTRLKLVDKRRAHWILQLVGSIMAIVGSIIKSLDKPVNFNTLHGKFGKSKYLIMFNHIYQYCHPYISNNEERRVK